MDKDKVLRQMITKSYFDFPLECRDFDLYIPGHLTVLLFKF